MKQTFRNGGFTLIEIMVVMVILGLLVAVVAPNLMGRSDQARVTVAKTQMKQVSNALDLYKLDNNRYPSTEQGLNALVEKPTGTPEPRNWNPDGYMPSVPRDPWDNPYDYSSPGMTRAYDLISYGADGREGGEGDAADLNIWEIE
ncbi:type II secretion system major pseudopilin GspG [Hydrocarboniclastica marina]|uniref:Type II secretion system core protein G n=1 Tax=Hydrocarboniclastica marina TaxID=2259620 RepID=A0A4P7XJN3_9ALTE|nr:type II secretion system major pseudopilin GspG [Hydrocarboniclastica marina]MAL99335.1 type II secretion system protein GspG [Alteromonadaceae bacterium]QCF26077.1 type II secretion system protein GspG [Hydrocarboniclastica marina]|tara:strand:- start:576 stop:1010 length:435 start_codon:yes stop_codon:yes gene_type:complete